MSRIASRLAFTGGGVLFADHAGATLCDKQISSKYRYARNATYPAQITDVAADLSKTAHQSA